MNRGTKKTQSDVEEPYNVRHLSLPSSHFQLSQREKETQKEDHIQQYAESEQYCWKTIQINCKKKKSHTWLLSSGFPERRIIFFSSKI